MGRQKGSKNTGFKQAEENGLDENKRVSLMAELILEAILDTKKPARKDSKNE